MVRGNGSARAETSVKAAARPNTIRIRMRRGPLRDTLDDDRSTITIPPFVTTSPWPWSDPFRLARDAHRNKGTTCMAASGRERVGANLEKPGTARTVRDDGESATAGIDISPDHPYGPLHPTDREPFSAWQSA